MLRADTSLQYLKGVGPRRAEALAAEGFETIEDLLYWIPRRYEDRRAFARVADLRAGGDEVTLQVRIEKARLIRTRRRGFTIFEAKLADDSGTIRAVWYNQAYLARVLREGERAVVFGGAKQDRYGRTVLENPEYEFLEAEDAEGIHTGRVVPVYRKLADLSPRMVRGLVHRALADLDPASLEERVPRAVREAHDLPERAGALRDVHFPPRDHAPGQLEPRGSAAHRALAFEEIYLLQLALALRRHGLRQESRGIAYEVPDALRTRLARLLPFRLTAAQQRVIQEIGADLRADHPMNRLLQGDVGSGKTIVAVLTLLVAVENGYQGVLMAPTEILADQHARNVRRLLAEGGELSCRVELLHGSLKAAERRRVLAAIESGEANLVIGTHALFESGVRFRRLGLAVIDEQHRFGVLQRAALVAKGWQPDVLVMTATPIPRSMALTLYGDLDLSVIDELPPGRKPVRTVVRGEAERDKVYAGVRSEVRRGRQVYVVVPLVEESARSDLKAAEAFAAELRDQLFPEFVIGMLHGRMNSADKERVMGEFRDGKLQILVATTVIEVGVDVANATVMIVEHAERFGLSQLHQLRGRVGRGSQRSFCVLMVGKERAGVDARERLAVMEQTQDGFVVAERDLEIRGPGAVFGTQQHGLSDLQFLAEALRAPGLLEAARREAQAAVAEGEASREAALGMLQGLGGRWRRRLDLARVG